MDPILIAILVAVAVVAFVVHEVTSVDRALTRRAVHDFNSARGTQHHRQLLQCLQVLDSRQRKAEAERSSLESRLRSVDGRCRAELIRTLVDQIVRSRLGEVRGIGPSLQADILYQCFDGTLASLNRAYNVRGIGPERQQAISAWTRMIESQLPDLLAHDFSGKAQVVARYQEERMEIDTKLATTAEELSKLARTEGTAKAAAARLDKVSASDFASALKSGTCAQEPLVLDHLRGLFAEWEPVPIWYTELLNECGV